MEFRVWPRVHGQGRGREGVTTKDLKKLWEEVYVMRRWGNHLEEMSDEEEESIEEAKHQEEINLVRFFKSVIVVSSIPQS